MKGETKMNDFMNFIGYRESLIDEKVEECLEAARHGEKEVSIDPGDLTRSELEQVQREVERRIRSGGY